jgi:hypothetical protein
MERQERLIRLEKLSSFLGIRSQSGPIPVIDCKLNGLFLLECETAKQEEDFYGGGLF